MANAEGFLTLNFTIDGDGFIEAKYPCLTFSKGVSIATVKEKLRTDYNVQAHCKMRMVCNGQELNDLLILENAGLVNNDIVKVVVIDETAVRGPAEIPAGVRQMLAMTPDALIANFVADNNAIENLLRNNPTLAQAVLNNDIFSVQQWQHQTAQEWQQRVAAEQSRRAQMNSNPFSSDNQAQIMEEIRQQQVMENYQQALEHMPEAFGRVVMLYVPMKIEGHPVVAFVDSGAQSTIISKTLAEKTGILRLLDRRYAGVAQGVGQARIFGKIHMVTIQFGNLHIPCSFTVMDDRMELLFGLDMLKRYRGCIDLDKNVLRIQGEEVRFLSESEIPKIRAQNRQDAGLPVDSPSPPTSPEQKKDDFPDEDVGKLISLGFSPEQAQMGLRSCEGNVDLAASFLMQQGWNPS